MCVNNSPCGSGGEPAGCVGCCSRGLGLECDASCRRWGSPTPTKVKNLLPPEPPHVSLEATAWGGAWGLGTLTSVFYSSEMSSQRKGRGEGKAYPIRKNIGVFNVRGCKTNEEKKGEIGKMFLRRRFDVCALNDTKLKRKGEVMFGKVMGRMSGVAVGRVRKGVALLLSERLMRCVVEWKKVSSRLMWVRVKIERELGVYIGIWTR